MSNWQRLLLLLVMCLVFVSPCCACYASLTAKPGQAKTVFYAPLQRSFVPSTGQFSLPQASFSSFRTPVIPQQQHMVRNGSFGSSRIAGAPGSGSIRVAGGPYTASYTGHVTVVR